ncbi:MAG: polysaccharide deacetylase family protein, partial [Chloroflexota bacterium]
SEAGDTATYFPETRHTLDSDFKQFWQDNGGLFVFGFPISEEFEEDGRKVQYFERARFEWWPEHEGTRYEVQLGHLGHDAAAANGVDTGRVERVEGAPDYNNTLEPRAVDVPILMYHDFGDPKERYRMSLSRFEEQVSWLRENGYESITMTQLYDAIYEGASLPEKPVILTFDDAFPAHWNAADILDRYGMKGVFFITLHEPRMRDDQIHDLANRGHEIGAHTFAHRYSTELDEDELWREIAGSRQELIDMGAGAVDFFAYPYGDYDERTIETVKSAGYRGAVAAWGGSHCTPERRWDQPRIEVGGQMKLEEFQQLMLSNGIDQTNTDVD